VKTIKTEALKRLTSHPEYGCVKLGNLKAEDLRQPEQMKRLSESVKKQGILTPLLIQVEESGERYLRDGHHRAVVAIALGLDTVPVIVTKS
jgi:ParB-like chromosome segregation protein Spo0J